MAPSHALSQGRKEWEVRISSHWAISSSSIYATNQSTLPFGVNQPCAAWLVPISFGLPWKKYTIEYPSIIQCVQSFIFLSVSNSPFLHSDHALVWCRKLVIRVFVTRLLERMRSRVVFACAGLGALCGLLFGIVPSFGNHQSCSSKKRKSNYDIPRSVILNVVLLNLLDMVVSLWVVHSFCTETVC